MARRSHGSRLPKRHQRPVIQAFRTVDPFDSEGIAGAMLDLEAREKIPPLNNAPLTHREFALDPRVTSNEYAKGVRDLWSVVEALSLVSDIHEVHTDGTLIAQIGLVTVRGKNIVAFVDNPQTTLERRVFHGYMSPDAEKNIGTRELHRLGNAMLTLGTFEDKIHDAEERLEVASTISSALVEHQAEQFELGRLEIE